MHLAWSELTSELCKDSPQGVRKISGVEPIGILGTTNDELEERKVMTAKKHMLQ